MSLTDKIITHPGDVIKIAGVPGAGKTTEVVRLAERESKKSILYLSFGKQNTRNAKRKMPKNVTCASFHSFAYSNMGIDKKRVIPSINLSQYCNSLALIDIEIRSPVLLECFSLLNDFFCMSGLPLNQASSLFSDAAFPNVSKGELAGVLKAFLKWWNACWESGSTIPITHDMYFKAYSLNCSPVAFDYLVIDECQDLNNAMFSMSIRLNTLSPKMKMVRLGDPCQQLFGFRGSSEQFANGGFDLTIEKTHRFGNRLCDVVNSFMAVQTVPHYTRIKSDKDHTVIQGNPGLEKIISNAMAGMKQTIIAKYNISLWHILKAFSLNNVKCSMLGGVDIKEFDFLKQLYRIYVSGGTGNAGRLRGVSYERYRMQASINRDNAAILACKFIENIEQDGLDVFRKIESHLTSPAKADIMLTTVHQAKGLEFKNLIMMDDFAEATSGRYFQTLPSEEAYLIYTAMTRAIDSLSLPSSWSSVV